MHLIKLIAGDGSIVLKDLPETARPVVQYGTRYYQVTNIWEKGRQTYTEIPVPQYLDK